MPASLMLGVAGLLSAAQPVASEAMNLLMWNPHWQCFIWNQNNCKSQVESHANDFLQRYDVDFANFVELEDQQYQPPGSWSIMRNDLCSKDKTAVVWNSRKWSQSTTHGSSKQGCMASDDRPFIVQTFERSAGFPDKVIVVGAHFPHPHSGFASELTSALGSVMKETGVKDVVLIADTNEFNGTSSRAIGEYLGFPDNGNGVVSTSLEHTCCADYDFPASMTFDRILSNFGVSMETTVLIDEPLPSWARQVQGWKKGAFHKPLLGKLSVPGTNMTPAGVTAGSMNEVTTIVV